MNSDIINKLREKKNSFWLPEMEILSEDEAKRRKELWQDLCDLDGLTVFAVNGGGDMFAWDDSDTVWFIEHDSGSKSLFARDLPSAFFRRAVEFAAGEYTELCTDDEKADMDEDDAQDYISVTEAVGILRDCHNALKDHFTERQNEIIGGMIKNGFDENNEFISYDTFRNIITEITA